MVHGTKTTTKQRISPNKGRTNQQTKQQTKNSAPFLLLDKKSESLIQQPTLKGASQELIISDEDLLTPDFILKTYATKKTDGTQSSSPTSLEENLTKKIEQTNCSTNDNPNTGVCILELLSKKDNLEKLASSVSKVIDNAKPIVPVQSQQQANRSPPTTPAKKSNSERFAGLSNSPAASTLPIPSFSFLDQELSKGFGEDTFTNQPTNLKTTNSSPNLLSRPRAMTSFPSTPQPMRNDLSSIPNKSFTPQPVKASTSSKKNRKPSPPSRQKSNPDAQRAANSAPPRYNPNVTNSVSIPIQPPVRALNHSPPSNPHLDELSSQLRMMLNINPVQS